MSIPNRQPGVERSRRRPTVLVDRGGATATLSNLALWPAPASQRAIAGRPVGPIGYVLDNLSDPSQRFVRDEILELGRYGVRVHVFVLEPGGDSAENPWMDGVAPSMSRIPASAFFGEAGADSSPGRILRAQAAWIAREVTARGIDHLHATQLAAADVVREVKRRTGVRYSFAAAGSEIYHDIRDPRTLRHKLTEAEFVVVPSEVSRQQLLRVIGAGGIGNIHRIYRGVDLGTFRYGADPFHDSSSVLAVCPFVEQSGVADLIDALAILRDRRPEGIRATIVGEGELEDDLRARIAALGLGDCVTMIRGPVDSARLLALMRSHAVMALPVHGPPRWRPRRRAVGGARSDGCGTPSSLNVRRGRFGSAGGWLDRPARVSPRSKVARGCRGNPSGQRPVANAHGDGCQSAGRVLLRFVPQRRAPRAFVR